MSEYNYIYEKMFKKIGEHAKEEVMKNRRDKAKRAIEAIKINNFDTVLKLLKVESMDPDSPIPQDFEKENPMRLLHYAALNGSFEIYQLLILLGARNNLADQNGNTPDYFLRNFDLMGNDCYGDHIDARTVTNKMTF